MKGYRIGVPLALLALIALGIFLLLNTGSDLAITIILIFIIKIEKGYRIISTIETALVARTRIQLNRDLQYQQKKHTNPNRTSNGTDFERKYCILELAIANTEAVKSKFVTFGVLNTRTKTHKTNVFINSTKQSRRKRAPKSQTIPHSANSVPIRRRR